MIFGLPISGISSVCRLALMSREAAGSPLYEGGRHDVSVARLFDLEDFYCWDLLTLAYAPYTILSDNALQPCSVVSAVFNL